MKTERRGPLAVGKSFGTFVVERALGHGASSDVYLVRNPADGLPFAVKVLDPLLTVGSDARVQRFIREAEFSVSARHANLVAVADAGKDPDTKLCYITMEYMPGGSLRERLAREGALAPETAVRLARDILRALHFVEANGLVHRDVKPDNILFAADGTAKLADLGIVRFSDDDADGAGGDRMTLVGSTIGTPAYMAPEQMIDSHEVDIRADLYSLGVVLYEAVTGVRPTGGASAMETLANQMTGAAFPDVRTIRPELSASFAAFVASLTDPDAAQRPASAEDALRRLEALGPATAPPAPTRRLEPVGSGSRPLFERMKPLALPLAVAFAALVLLAFVVVRFAARL